LIKNGDLSKSTDIFENVINFLENKNKGHISYYNYEHSVSDDAVVYYPTWLNKYIEYYLPSYLIKKVKF